MLTWLRSGAMFDGQELLLPRLLRVQLDHRLGVASPEVEPNIDQPGPQFGPGRCEPPTRGEFLFRGAHFGLERCTAKARLQLFKQSLHCWSPWWSWTRPG